MEIVFLGTGGGRFNLVKQIRRTGGFRINGSPIPAGNGKTAGGKPSGSLNIHVDPGPGALFSSIRFKQDASKVDLLILTHNHIDHTNDAGLMVEAFSTYGKRNGFAIGSKSAINGDDNRDRGISKYHLGNLEKYWIATPGKKMEIHIRGRRITLRPIKVRHDDRTGFGFVIEMDGKRIGYTSDTEYYGGMAKQYTGCDALIVNCLKPKKDNVPGHMDSTATARLLSEAKPALAILTHFGVGMLAAGPEKEAARIGKMSGVRTVAAKDGMKVSINNRKSSRTDRKA